MTGIATAKEITNKDKEEEAVQLMLPYIGKTIVEKVQKYVRKIASKKDRKVKVSSVFKSKKLGSRFILKDKTKPEHLHNLVYYVPCANKKCKLTYSRETKRSKEKGTSEHRMTDPNSHALRHSRKTEHKRVKNADFKILRQGLRSNFRRKVVNPFFSSSKNRV